MVHPKRRLREIARVLRQRSTPAERRLWAEVRDRRLGGLRFLRQHPIGSSIVDFYCHELRLVVELEGAAHDDPEQKLDDQARFAELRSRDLRVLRIRNDVVMREIELVLEKILSFKP